MASTPAETREALAAATRIVEWYDAHPIDADKTDDTYTVVRALLASHGERDAVLEEAAKVADSPYSDLVDCRGPDEPLAVGKKIATAIRSLRSET